MLLRKRSIERREFLLQGARTFILARPRFGRQARKDEDHLHAAAI
jgi:hypothetical protein